MPPELSPEERAAIISVLREKIDGDRFPLSPRLRPLKSALSKLAPEPPRQTYPPPKQGERSLVLRKGKRRR